MFTEALAPLGIEGRHFAVLATLADADVAMSQRQLYDQVRSDKASMVRVIDDLEALGLVVRAPAAGDRRVRAVTLTEHGRHVCATAETTSEQVATRLLGQLEATEREQLVGLLRRIAHPAADTSTAVRTSAAVTGPRSR
jgi:DNA-binding MarR family transcriptional regulator